MTTNLPSLLDINSRALEVSLVVLASCFLYKLAGYSRSRMKSVKLRGPPSASWLFGASKEVFQGDPGVIYERMANEFGSAFSVPGPFGSRRTALFDAKAIAYVFSKEPFTFTQSTFVKRTITNIVGKGLSVAEGESHRRQRRSLTPAFSIAAIRDMTPVFLDSGYKVKSVWDAIIDASPTSEEVIDVQKWMNCISLDSLGIAAFGHDFEALDGKHSEVKSALDTFGSSPPRGLSAIVALLGPFFPVLEGIPTKRSYLMKSLHSKMASISKVLLEKSRKEKEAGIEDAKGSISNTIIGALVKALDAESKLTLSHEEVLAQMKVLIVAGYETTSISLTWALIELARNPEMQDKLREELSPFISFDPTYDQLSNTLPYLDAISREVLRVHPPVMTVERMAKEDEILPFTSPIITADGKKIDSLLIAKGESVLIPIRAINRSAAIWGPDAKDFKPERWLEDEQNVPLKAKQFQGFHHLLTFIDGPRVCIGRGFAVAEFKSVLSVLIRNFAFEMRDGPDTKVDTVITLLPRPKIKGEDGSAMPLRVRRL